jgi:hypothetical protein
MRVTGLSILPGSPIRKSSDHSSVDSSPRHIAASHVLHRLLVPRHPPCALSNLATKMLASTVQFSKNGRPRPHTQTHPHPQQGGQSPEGPVRTATTPPHPEPKPQAGGTTAMKKLPLPQDPTARHTTPPTPARPVPPPPRRARSTRHQNQHRQHLKVSIPRH